MKPPSKKLWLALTLAIVLVVAIAIVTGRDVRQAVDLSGSNLVFVNRSSIPVGSVGIHFTRWDGTGESSAGMNADGSMLGRGDRLYFDAGGWPVTVTVCRDLQGWEPIAQTVVEQAPPETLEECVWYVIARDGPGESMTLTLSLNLDEKDLEEMEGVVSRNLGVDVSDGTISYCWYPGHGWQGDGEDFVAVRFSPQAAEELERQIGETEGWTPFPVPAGLKEAFVSVYSHESHIDWDDVSDSGWFYFYDEQEERHSAQSGGRYDSWDYVAAVYDRENRTLYFFEWHQ